MASINYKNLTTAKDFANAANSLYKRNMSTKRDMQSALMCAIKHMDTCGDWSSSIKPLLDVGASFGKNLNVALQEWVLKFTWLAYDEKAKAFHKDQSKAMDLEGAANTEWWTMEKAAKAVPYDFQKALAAFFDGLTKEMQRDGTTLDVNTVRSGLLSKVLDVVPVEDQVPAMFAKLNVEDMNAVLGQLVDMVPQVKVQSTDEVAEPESIAA